MDMDKPGPQMNKPAMLFEQGIPMQPGESLHDFRSAMDTALSAWWVERGIHDTDETGWWYLREVYADAVICRVRPANGQPRLVRMAFVRDANGAFSFGDPVDVVQRTSFEPVVAQASEAVANATAAQRRNLPPAAYAIPYYADADGNYMRSGTEAQFRRSLSALPHHVRTVQRTTEDTTVDLRRLRNALARAGQVDVSRFTQEAVTAGVNHVKAHARRLLRNPTRDEGLGLEMQVDGVWCFVLGGAEAVGRLRRDLDDVDSGHFADVRRRQEAEGIWTLARTLAA